MSQPAEDLSASYMKPRSIILDLFGDYLRYSGNQVKAGDLVALLGVFGVEAATTRMTLSRLRREDWFTTHRVGRETVYRLTDRMDDILEQGRARIFADYDQEWDRGWTLVVNQGGLERFTRDQVRRRLAWLGFGPVSSSTWIAPRARTEDTRALQRDFPDLQTVVMQSSTSSLAEDRALAARCWDLDSINRAYAEFLDDHPGLPEAAEGLSGSEALITRTSLIAGYRHFPFIDPWLPRQLRPTGWLGDTANQVFRSTHALLDQAAHAYVASVIAG